ncbi:MAG TPA: translocation/assembly module TamB domain-containing protein, partial [Rhizomicrobium sp.]|nr:translocation/assembly module TamB domain-containing protein [Rhizomicrobium sp.]
LAVAKAVAGQDTVLSAFGSVRYVSLRQVSGDIAVARRGSPDSYTLKGAVAQHVIIGRVSVREGPDGILANVLGLPGLGPINLTASAEGNANANKIRLNLSAGPLRANGTGKVSLETNRVDLDVAASAPAMTLRAGLGFGAFSLDGHIRGSLKTPSVAAKFGLANAFADDFSVRRILTEVHGSDGNLDIAGSIDGARTATVALFAQAPIAFDAHVDLADKTYFSTFALNHPLASASGIARYEVQQLVVQDRIALPVLAAFAPLLHETVTGTMQAHINATLAHAQSAVDADGSLTASGPSLAARLLGPASQLSVGAKFGGTELTALHAILHGAGVAANVSAAGRDGKINGGFSLWLSNVSRLAPTIRGPLTLWGRITGRLRTPIIQGEGNAKIASVGFSPQPLKLSFNSEALRKFALSVDGRFDDAPLAVRSAFDQQRRATLSAKWKSLEARAAIAFSPDFRPSGAVNMKIADLRDLASLAGTRLSGWLGATVGLDNKRGATSANFNLSTSNLAVEGGSVSRLGLSGRIDKIFAAPLLDATLSASGLSFGRVNGGAHAQFRGNLSALRVVLATDDASVAERPFEMSAAATANITGKRLSVSTWKGLLLGQHFALAAPTTFDFADGIVVDHIRVDAAGGTLTLSGRLAPSLSASLVARGIRTDAFAEFVPLLPTDGSFSANAELSGSTAMPRGTFAIEGRNLTPAGFSNTGRAALDLHGRLDGTFAAIEGALKSGTTAQISLKGTLPLHAGGPVALALDGNADLNLLNLLLARHGLRMQGKLEIKAGLNGSLRTPLITGTARIENGIFEDVARGIHLRNLTATANAGGNTIAISKFEARAGKGTMNGSGAIVFAEQHKHISFSAQLNRLRLIASDFMTAELSGAISLEGPLGGSPLLSGRLEVPAGEIDLPDSFPPDVVTLNIRRRGRPVSAAPPPVPTNIDVTIDTANRLLVRGRGIDASVFGHMRVTGSNVAPLVSGEFELSRGTFSLAGQTLTFDSGRVTFDNAGFSELNPWLDFEAHSQSGGISATLTISGYASQPTITLSSVPALPQDEILARLLFQESASQLSGLQLADMAQAVAQLGGLGSRFNPLGLLRKRLGLDRLTVGSTTPAAGAQTQTTIEAGRYVARDVYVGVRQSLSGTTQAQVQYDISRHLKAQATVSTGTTSTIAPNPTLQDNGSSAGLSYQFEY